MIFEQVKLSKLTTMKTKIVPIITIAVIILSLLFSCDDTNFKEYLGYEPVYLSYTDLRAAVRIDPAEDLKNPGKMYFKDNYIFIVEELKGIHIIDNSNPSAPVNKSFINIPGVIDISMSGFYLYADSYVDLVVLDLQNLENIVEAGRLKDLLPYTVPQYDTDYPVARVDRTKGVVTSWELKKVKERIYNNDPVYPIYRGISSYYDMMNSSGASSGISGSGIGIGGSMARFGIKDNVLYVLEQNKLNILNITNKTNPVKTGDLNLGRTVETMFLTENRMFLGTTTGMVIYDISIPLNPFYKSFFTHVRSCDPVIVDDTLAFTTLRSGTTCGGFNNTLNVVNIKDILVPKLVKVYSLINPHGLGKDGDLLFICDGAAGLKIFNCSDAYHITDHLLYTYTNINAFDVIPLGGILILIGDDGLFQYDYSDIGNINLLSTIPITAE
jgi:hypothetical protein